MSESLPLALITGGTSGIGLATARRLQQRYRLALLYGHDHQRAEQAALELPGCRVYCVDLTSPEQIESGSARIEAELGGLPEVLVNSAGMRGFSKFLLQGVDLQGCAQLMDLHFFGTLRMVQKVLPSMYARRRGAIVNLSSISAQGGY